MNKKGRVEFVLGILLIIAAFGLTVYNVVETNNAGSAAREALDLLSEQVDTGANNEKVDKQPDYVLHPKMSMPVTKIKGLNYVAILDIPDIRVRLPILSEYVYNNLRISPCRYTGSVYSKDMVICAHNYRSHFGRLKELSEGSRLTLTDMDGNVFTYEVKEIIVLNPKAIEEFTDNGYDLTLFTCTIGGASRVTVRCDMIETKKPWS